ncbi:ribonuclease [Gemmobacter aquarius]|uniref:Ribonuclease n=1 Tax=Paragemmobacter aquarius TaxID=2169400 RepID=A0A2S0UIL3_9RHOB|nr:YihY/virulence factor BrkB family protein [Gemmobacter aquarius]AWB47653.1 ribonuclease [Gemmobacter aquarius]
MDTGNGRGREAVRPRDIPAEGWKDIALRVWKSLGEDKLLLIAAGVTFYLLLALFPALGSFVALYGLIADPATVAEHVSLLQGVMPGPATELLSTQMTRLAGAQSGDLGLSAIIALLISLWSANGGVKAIFEGVNIAYDEQEKRSFLRLTLATLAFTLGAMVLLIALIGALAVLPAVLALAPFGEVTEIVVSLLRWPLILVLIGLALAVLYRFAPSRTPPEWKWVTWGSGLATVLWVAASVAFSVYLESFADFGASYGAMAAPIAFLLWVWISIIVILLGAEVNAEMEHQTAHDTTAGSEKPMGQRGAEVADTLGETADR